MVEQQDTEDKSTAEAYEATRASKGASNGEGLKVLKEPLKAFRRKIYD